MRNERRSLSPNNHLLQRAKEARVDHEDYMKQWLLAASVPGSVGVAGLEQFLDWKVAETLFNAPFYVPTERQLLVPETKRLAGYGFVSETKPFIAPIDALTRHALILGATGTGKTTLLRLLIMQVMAHAKVWIVEKDKAGADYRFLAAHPEVIVLDAQSVLALNPLEVHTPITLQETITAFVQVFCKSFGLLVGSQSQIVEVLYDMFGDWDLARGSPTLYDLEERTRRKKFPGFSRSGQMKDSILNRLRGMLREAPDTYSYSKGFSLPELANKHVIFELQGINDHHGRFMVLLLWLLLFKWRMKSGLIGAELSNLLVVDEASWFAPKFNDEHLGFSPLAQVMSQSRAAGLGTVLASQAANGLDNAVFVNTEMKIGFRLGDGQCIERASKAMALNKEQQAYIPKLGVGECIAQVPEVDPFVLRVPDIEKGWR